MQFLAKWKTYYVNTSLSVAWILIKYRLICRHYNLTKLKSLRSEAKKIIIGRLKVSSPERVMYNQWLLCGWQKSQKIMTSTHVRTRCDGFKCQQPPHYTTYYSILCCIFCAPLRSSITALITFHGMVSLLSRREVCFVFSTKAGPKPGSFHRSPKVAWQPIPWGGLVQEV